MSDLDLRAMLAYGTRVRGHCFAPGTAVSRWLGIEALAWNGFSGHWKGLTLDRHMADGGRYRFRRYGAFELQLPGQLQPLAHAPYVQPLDVNRLNGGVEREFDALEPGFATHGVLASLVAGIVQVIDDVEGGMRRWNIRLHPYRIVAHRGSIGLPTPEGLHRDGVDYIVTLMVRRHNVEGGQTRITDARRRLVWHHTLANAMDLIVADDVRTMHAVTPVAAVDADQPAFRDVLVIAFTKI